MKKIIILPILTISLVFSFTGASQAQTTVDYGGQPALDSDLDGLTDKGELQIYKTDPHDPDTDSDSMLDGAEVIGGTDPSDNLSFIKLAQDASVISQEKEVPWAWYAVRASGLVAFFLLYLNMFFGLAIRMPGLNKLIKPVYSLETHCDLSIHSILFVIPHAALLLIDKVMRFEISEILIPFTSQYDPEWVGFGTIAFYLMAVLILTSYFRRHFSHKIWRATHFLNIILYFAVAAHSLFLGTDLKERVPANIFLAANGLLFFMFLTGLSVMLFRHFKKPVPLAQNNGSEK